MTLRRVGIFSTVLALSAAAAHAGGLVLPVRGVRTVQRGGAFVAGADDADALWLDPAGLAHLAGRGKRALLFDAAVVYHSVEHTRIADDGTPFAPATNQQPGQPLPSLAGAYGVTDRLVIAGGLTSPYAGGHRYAPDGPQRYASVAMEDARLVLVTVGFGYRASDRLRIGGTVQNLVSQLSTAIVVSGCPGATACAPEDRTFDAALAIEQDDYIAPSGSLGVQYDARPGVTVGLAVQAPLRVSGSGTLAFELPSSPRFETATVTGDRGRIALTLPPVVRAGVEWRPTARLRVEAALGVELWSLHDGMELEPIDVRVDGIAGQGTLDLQPMRISRDYRTSIAPALAVEWHGPKLMLGAGYSYETAAAPPGEVSVLAVDAAKHLVGAGGGYEDAGWQIGAALGFVAVDRVDVPVADARVPQLAPLAEPAGMRAINAGRYTSRYLIAGLRFARRW